MRWSADRHSWGGQEKLTLGVCKELAGGEGHTRSSENNRDIKEVGGEPASDMMPKQ